MTVPRPGVSVGRSAYTVSRLCLQLVGRSTTGHDGKNAKNQNFFEISNGRLPLEDGSDRRETLAKRVSDDLQFFIFWHRKKKDGFFFQKFSGADFFFQETWVLEELGLFDPRWQLRRKKLLPQLPLFLGRLPWRRGKRLNMCRKPGLGTENDFNHLDLWSDDFCLQV